MRPGERIAAVDIGTNSVLLVVATLDENGRLLAEHERCAITRLGQGVDRLRRLDPRAIGRTLAALRDAAETLERHDVEVRAAIGTAALRDADNAQQLIGPAQEILRCPVEIISGEREADLVLAGVRGSFGELPQGTLICDVGGGSTELIRTGAARPAAQRTSLPIGAVSLTERHIRKDPAAAGELRQVREAITAALNEPAKVLSPVEQLIGVAGTVTTLAAVELGLDRYDSHKVNGLWLTVAQIRQQLRGFAALPRQERQRIPGLDPARADVILAGTLVVVALLELFDQPGLKVCDRGIRWGLLHELAHR